jgi:type IV pilus assembly protein PilC
MFKHTIKLKDVHITIQHFAALMDACIPIPQILHLLYVQSDKVCVKTLLKNVRICLENGENLSTAFRVQDPTLPGFIIIMMEIGERTGKLAIIFRDLASHINRRLTFNRVVWQASIYPMLLLLIAFVSVGFMVFKVLPSFVSMFADAGGELPRLTRILLDVSEFFKNYFVLAITIVSFLMPLAGLMLSQSQFRRFLDRILIKLPVLGDMLLKLHISYLFHNLNLLLSNGVHHIDALQIIQKSCRNLYLKREISLIIENAICGVSLYGAFSSVNIFPQLTLEMIRIGEESSQIPKMLDKLVTYYDMEIEQTLKGCAQLIEPFFILIIGCIIGIILMALYVPVFRMVNNVSF